MTVHELSREQLTELKQHFLMFDKNGEQDVSMDELANIDNLVSDEEIYKYYDNFSFTDDDFFASGGSSTECGQKYKKTFDSVEDCLNYLAEEGYLCGGDSIELIGSIEDPNEVEEIRTYGSCHNILSAYRIKS